MNKGIGHNLLGKIGGESCRDEGSKGKAKKYGSPSGRKRKHEFLCLEDIHSSNNKQRFMRNDDDEQDYEQMHGLKPEAERLVQKREWLKAQAAI